MLTDKKKLSKTIWKIALLAGILLLGAYFRFYSINWDENFHLHPDERFLTMLETSLSPVGSLRNYFNTAESSLNPHNILDANGNSVFPFFVYGTFPLILVRYVAGWLGMTGYNDVHIVGRYLSGVFDIGTILVVFLIARELFREKWLLYLAALFYTCAILPIQISHFFIVDNFATFFSTLAMLFAVRAQKFDDSIHHVTEDHNVSGFLTHWRGFRNYAFFGIALGLAAASKVNTLVIAALLPAALVLKDIQGLKDLSSSTWKFRIRNLILSGIISFVVFRIFQPYGFTGPGFFEILPNPRWIANLRELSFISSGDSNYPPSIQWARRSFWFPIKNLIVWGLGLPVGVLASGGLLFMAYKLVIGERREFALLWLFSFFYLVWQALRWNPTMRYFLILYPVLVILAAWMVGQIVLGLGKINRKQIRNIGIGSLLAVLTISAILGSISFLNVYSQPMTRIAASEWIYRHIPGAVNLNLTNAESEFIQPLPYPNYTRLGSGESFSFEFSPSVIGQVSTIRFDYVVNPEITEAESSLSIVISSLSSGEVLFSKTVQDGFQRVGDSRGEPFEIFLETPINVVGGQRYQFDLSVVSLEGSLQFFGNIDLEIALEDLSFSQSIFEFTRILEPESAFVSNFSPIEESQITGIEFFRWLNLNNSRSVNLGIELVDVNSGAQIINQSFVVNPDEPVDFRGSQVSIKFDQPVKLEKDGRYALSVKMLNENAMVAINGSKTVKETDWDDVLPLYMYGYNPFDSYEGISASDLNFQIYWDDDNSKLDRFFDGLNQADYFIITSSRQWGSVTQMPERYPLSTYFYRQLIGCQADDVQWCYRVAEPDRFNGSLGFDLVQTFQVNPAIFGMEFNSQFAEEAFTVYDHPKVLVFEKSDEFDFNNVINQLTSIDLDHVMNISIKESEERPGLLTMPLSQKREQKNAGTWSELFDYRALFNSNKFLGTAVWYLLITLLGWISYPIVRSAFSGLNDKGFPVAKLTGLILWAFIAWIGSSHGIPFSRTFIVIALLVVVIFNLALFLVNRKAILSEIKGRWRYFAFAELISLGFFLFFLLIRLGNPDLWHPYKGGEKPMDFAYLNAIIKSVEFPPYDPWYAGGYINYYYFGFVISGIVIKLLGIVPSIAYNLILPTFFTFTGMAAFSLGWNLFKSRNQPSNSITNNLLSNPYLWGSITALFVLIIGNLGSVSMFFQGVFKLGMEGGQTIGVGIIDKLTFFFKGLARLIQGANFSFYPGDWYWIPSRAIPGTVITEFPYFSFLYGDPHAHLFAYPITLTALGWSLSLVLGKPDLQKFWHLAGKISVGALLIGILRPTNTWDYPVFLAVGSICLFYALLTRDQTPKKFLPGLDEKVRRVFFSILLVASLAVLSFILFSPFDRWYGQAYTSIEFWQGDKTPLWAYFVHWGFYLFIIFSWLSFTIWRWMKSTPLLAMEPYYRNRKYAILAALVLVLIVAALIFYGVNISIIAIPLLAIFSILLVFDQQASDSNRFVSFLILTGLALTIVVELITLRGDIGRMNTVFKFYLQAWSFIAVGGAYLLLDLLYKLQKEHSSNDHTAWKVLLGLFCLSVLLFPLLASMDKINDRMNDLTPLTLDGMEYMKYSTYPENETLMDLSQDYYAIRWIQENVIGTPVIAEANIPEYRWGSRYSIYTGLPSTVGWNWHQRQQRAINPGEWVFERVEEVTDFYSTTDIQTAQEFIEQYDVEYIVLGQLEKAVYPQEGLMKFKEFSGKLWDIVYESADTSIFKVRS